MDTRIIFVEGQPGCGKSTISQFIAQQLTLNGKLVYWLDEYEHDGIYFMKFWEDYEKPFEIVINTLINCWKDLIERIEKSDKIFIMDSAFFSYTLYLLNLEISKTLIGDYFKTLNMLLANLKPKIIFFKGETSKIIGRACERRGEVWTNYTIKKIEEGPYQQNRNRTGFEGIVDYFSDGQKLYLELMPLCNFPILQIDVTEENWNENENIILNWLGFTKIDNEYTIDTKELEKYLGKYQVPKNFPAKGEELNVTQKDGKLVLVGKFWNDYKLLPKSNTKFIILGIPMELNFKIENDKVLGFDYTFIDNKSYYCEKVIF